MGLMGDWINNLYQYFRTFPLLGRKGWQLYPIKKQFKYMDGSASMTYCRTHVFISLFTNHRVLFDSILLRDCQLLFDSFYFLTAVSHVVSRTASNVIATPMQQNDIMSRLHSFFLSCFHIFIYVVPRIMSFFPFQQTAFSYYDHKPLHSTVATISPYHHSCSYRVLKLKQKPH